MTSNHVEKYGGWALVTGASQGIGRRFAEVCARQGFPLVMIARRQELLESEARKISDTHGVETRTLALDLTAPGCVDAVRESCRDLEIGMLINNAAFSTPGEFLELSLSSIERQIRINVHVTAMMCHHFGNLMKARGRGAIINVSSRTGEVAMPYFAMYSATKSFVSVFSEALWFELKGHGVDVLALKPDQTATEGYLSMNPGDWGEGIQTVEDCVSEAFDALGRHAGWLSWPPSREDVRHLRSIPLEEAIAVNGAGMKQVFARQLGG